MRLSLRIQVALVATLTILVPLAAYLVMDVILERQSILTTRVELLTNMGELLADQAAASPQSLEPLLLHLGEEHPDLDVMLLGQGQEVLASTEQERVGTRWDEDEIDLVLAGETDATWALDSHGDLPVVEITVPVAGERAIHLAEPQARLQQLVRESTLRSTAFVVGLVVLLALLVTLGTDRLVITRLGRMGARLQRTGFLPDRTHRGRDELEDLSTALEGMLGEIEAHSEALTREVEAARQEITAMQAELLRKERLSALGELAGALAHEVRNPLQIIRGTAELARRRHPAAQQELDDVIEEVARLELLVRQLLDYTRPLALERERFDLAPWVEGALREVSPPEGVTVDLGLPQGLEVYGDPTLLHRVLVNVLTNAVEAMEGQGHLEVRVEPGQGLHLVVGDDGPGVEPEDLEHLFKPFFTRKAAGTGLGLALSRRILTEHRGELSLDSQPGQGATVHIRLPGASP